MRVYLAAGGGYPLPKADVDLIRGHGMYGIRTNTLNNGTEREQAEVFKRNGLDAIFLGTSATIPVLVDAIRTAAMQQHIVVEPENEPDFHGIKPEDLARTVRAATAQYPDIQFLVSVSFRGQDYLAKVMAAGIPEQTIIGFQSYRNTPPEQPLPGFASREAEFARWRELAGGRRLWCTECGWHTGRFRVGGIKLFGRWFFARYRQFTDEQVAEFVKRELALHAAHGIEVFVYYQITDGPTEKDIDRFGIRRIDGSIKPVASVLGDYEPPRPLPG